MSGRRNLSGIRHERCRILPKQRIAGWSKVLAVAANAIPSIIVFSVGSSAEHRSARNDVIITEAVRSRCIFGNKPQNRFDIEVESFVQRLRIHQVAFEQN